MSTGGCVMPKTKESNNTLSASAPNVVVTCAADDRSLAVSMKQQEQNRQGWQDVIDKKLIEWGRDPSQLADEDVVPPSRELVHLASEFATRCRDEGVPPPNRVVPNGDGGITFERWHDLDFHTIEILRDRSIDAVYYRDCRLIARESISGT